MGPFKEKSKIGKLICNVRSQESSTPLERKVVVLSGRGHTGDFWGAGNV